MKNNLVVIGILFLFNYNTPILAQKNPKLSLHTHETEVQVTYAAYLGKTAPLRNLIPMAPTSLEKRAKNKANRKDVKNFIGRGKYISQNPDALPQGEDPIRQSAIQSNHNFEIPVEPLVNIEGMSDSDFGGNPPDPSIDVGNDHVIQMINATSFQIRDKEGTAITAPIAANTIWSQLGFSSAGDPIVMYDHEADRWIITEFPFGNQLLFAITETSDPLGSWMAWNFSTPSFPDYPKYSIWPNAYCVTTNEDGSGSLPNYFIDRAAILNGDATVAIQRIIVPGISSGPGFQVSTPVDWTGPTPPPTGANPIILSLNDDAWGASPTDQIDIHEITIDWVTPSNSSVSTSSVVTSPFDTNPCAVNGPGFACIPQLNGQGLDGLPEVIMNQVHYRNFGSHESIVLNFITDATGTNVSGIRWMELRRSGGEWELYQEGTFAPNDGLHRFMGGICMDGSGNIGLAYNISGENIFAGLRFTGRKASDPLGEMTVDEYTLVEGENTIGSIRFGDYNHMSIDPSNDRTFWFTGEYAGGGGWSTRIAAFEIIRDTIDIGPSALLSPQNDPDLTDDETVTIEIKNFGIDTQYVFQAGYIFEGNPAVVDTINFILLPDSVYTHIFTPTVDMSVIGEYEFTLFTVLPDDQAIFNDTLRTVVSKLSRYDAGISEILNTDGNNCLSSLEVGIELTNFGTEILTSATIEIELNSISLTPIINWVGSLPPGESEIITVFLEDLLIGNNNISASSSVPNGEIDEVMINDSFSRNFDANPEGVTVTLALLTDSWPAETTWDLFDPNGNVLYSGGPYMDAGTLFEEEFCLNPDLCYTFTIYDSYGDGICCGFGIGNYSIYDDTGNPLLSSTGEFGSQESNEFCAIFECLLSAEFSTSPESEAGSADGVIMITALNGNGPFQYSIDGGQNFQSSNVFSGLAGGSYDIVISDGNSCVYEETITVDVCAMDILAEATNESAEGAGDGSFMVTVTNGLPPFQYSIDDGNTFQGNPDFSNLTAGTYVILVEDANGCRADLEVIIDFNVSNSDLNFGYLIELFPNPTEGMTRINVKAPNLGSVFLKYQVYDENGSLIQVSQLTKFNDIYTGQLSLVSYPAGIYFIRFKDKEIKRMLKLVKQ